MFLKKKTFWGWNLEKEASKILPQTDPQQKLHTPKQKIHTYYIAPNVKTLTFYMYITWEMVQDAHDNYLNIYAWTVDDPLTIENLILLGVDGIVTNKSDIKLLKFQTNL